MAASRLCQRTLSEFQPSSRLWVPVPSSCSPSQVTQPRAFTARLSLITQNLDAFPSRPISRAKLLLGAILEVSNRPDILFLQEVKSDVCIAILGNPQVREAFLVTDAEDQTSFEGVPLSFANMTLLSSKRFTFNVESQKEEHAVERGEKFMLGRVSRVKLPSKAWEVCPFRRHYPPIRPIHPNHNVSSHQRSSRFSLGHAPLPYRADGDPCRSPARA